MCRQRGQWPHEPVPMASPRHLLLMLQTFAIVSVIALAAAEPHERDFSSASKAAPKIEAASQATLHLIEAARLSNKTVERQVVGVGDFGVSTAREMSNGVRTDDKATGLRKTLTSNIGVSRTGDSHEWREQLQNASLRKQTSDVKRVKRTVITGHRGRRAIGQCEAGWTLLRQSCYMLTDALPWNEAQRRCLAMNASLVHIDDVNEESDLYNFLNQQRPGWWSAWMGLNDQQAHGLWLWDSAKLLTYNNFRSGEPNVFSSNEDCVEVIASTRAGWNDKDCNWRIPGVCERRQERCETGWLSRRQSCYKLTIFLPWIEAQRACTSLNASLTYIDSANKQNDVYEIVREQHSGLWSAWIGLNDRLVEGQFMWDSGRRPTYINWNRGEPNNAASSEHCAEILFEARAGWNARSCKQSILGVCEKPAQMPLPTQIRLVASVPDQQHSGMVEVQYRGEWGIVCDDGWGINEARVICRQLGYSDANIAISNMAATSSTQRFFLDDVACNGNEELIDQCRHLPWMEHDCTQNEGAGVVCQAFTGTCGGEFNSSGNFRSTNFNGNYPDNLNCTWNLRAAPGHEAMVLQIKNFSTERCCDHLLISDSLGLQLALSGIRRPHNITLGSSAIINFATDSSVTSTGFEISFISLRNLPNNMELSDHCGRGWFKNEGSCFKLTPSLPWVESQHHCGSMNASLVNENDNADMNYVFSYLEQIGVVSAWINGRINGSLQDRVRRRVLSKRWESDYEEDDSPLMPGPISSDDELICWRLVNQIIVEDRELCDEPLVGVCRKRASDNICGSQSRGPGVLTSPEIPDSDQGSIECTWIFTADREGNSLQLRINNLTMEECCNHLTISDGSGFRYTFSGVRQPHQLKRLHLQSPARIVFFSNTSSSEFRGRFNATIDEVLDSAPGICRSAHWTAIGESCFRVLRFTMGILWHKARYQCQSIGGLLAEITSDSQQQNAARFLINQNLTVNEVWIGLKREQQTDNWRWDSGRPLTFSNWKDGEPIGVSENVNCVAMNFRTARGWRAANCNEWKVPLCMLQRT